MFSVAKWILFLLPVTLTAGEVTKRFPYFGDLHVHTSWSLDSYVNFNRVGPRDAYRFAGGEPVVLSGGRVVRIDRPLDFAAVTEHAEYLGELPLVEIIQAKGESECHTGVGTEDELCDFWSSPIWYNT